MLATIAPTLVEALCLLVALAAVWAASLHWKSHDRHVIPGLAFIALTMAMEGAELFLLYLFIELGPAPEGHITITALVVIRLLTLFRIGSAIGFWLGVRYSRKRVMEVRTAVDAFKFAHAGWRGLFRTYLKRKVEVE